MSPVLREEVKRFLGPRWTTRLRCLVRGKGRPRWGNLRRVTPFSTNFGFDRGTPVDRYYLAKFLEAHRAFITGDVLEIQMPGYTMRYGHHLRRVDSVDINPYVRPTFVCDLAHSEAVLPSERYDCFLLPNTLQHLRELEASLRTALRVVRPGGVLFASAAGLLPLIPDGPDYWRFSAAGWAEVLERVWAGCDVRVESHGNCLAAIAAMLGLALEELTPSELDVTDPRYPVLITVACRKPLAVRAA
jgi:SAM-dependent methyltransferase